MMLVGCATPPRQMDAILRASPKTPPAAELKNVPFVKQTAGNCGPATLTMAILSTGKTVSIDEIAPMVMTQDKNGSLQLDMISAARREGLMAIQIDSLDELLREVAGGHPVIVFENLGLSWYPRWHYAIVFGYDLISQQVIMHSGPDAFKHVDMRAFESAWMLGNYWGLVVLPAGELSVATSELANLKAAAGLEQAGRINEANQGYQQILQRWPESLGALIGLGNVAYKRSDFRSAVHFLKRATDVHPDSIVARHNLEVADDAAHRPSSDSWAP